MFFTLSKLFAIFCFPFPLFIILCIVTAYKLNAGWFRKFFIFAFACLWIISCDFFANHFLGYYEKLIPAQKVENMEKCDAIVVLSGLISLHPAQGLNDRIHFNSAVDRILEGIRLFKAGKGEHLMIAGGSGHLYRQDVSEADLLRDWMIEMGLPKDRVLAEAKSRTTAETADEMKRIVAERGWKKIILVTSAYHLPRSMLVFKKIGIPIQAYPADFNTHASGYYWNSFFPSLGALFKSTRTLKEIIGILGYTVAGKI